MICAGRSTDAARSVGLNVENIVRSMTGITNPYTPLLCRRVYEVVKGVRSNENRVVTLCVILLAAKVAATWTTHWLHYSGEEIYSDFTFDEVTA